jgi:hypothetical protein
MRECVVAKYDSGVDPPSKKRNPRLPVGTGPELSLMYEGDGSVCATARWALYPFSDPRITVKTRAVADQQVPVFLIQAS